MLLALDVGNTHTTIGVFRGTEILRRWRLTTAHDRTVDELGIFLRQLCEWSGISPGAKSRECLAIPSHTSKLRLSPGKRA